MVEANHTDQASVLGSVCGGRNLHWSVFSTGFCGWWRSFTPVSHQYWVLWVVEVVYTSQSSVLGSVGSGGNVHRAGVSIGFSG